MKQLLGMPALCLAAALGGALPASAALVVQSNGTVYDSDRNIYWLQNANLAATNTFGISGIIPPPINAGMMYFATAQSWIAALNAAKYLGFSDWRLPTTQQPDATCTSQAPNPSVSYGYGCAGGELGHLFYTEFGALAQKNLSSGNAAEVAKFSNIQSFSYWTSTEDASNPGSYWTFDFNIGAQSWAGPSDYEMYVWPVRNAGTTSPEPLPVPEPGTLLLMWAGLFGLLAAKRVRRE
ncbi:MAG: DUF1566 domain-containing protein [Burkholderiales bacterium]|nr:DUF1566 domain-containing protein [Burkholderiales bacterium]